jgi:hypothetical protein
MADLKAYLKFDDAGNRLLDSSTYANNFSVPFYSGPITYVSDSLVFPTGVMDSEGFVIGASAWPGSIYDVTQIDGGACTIIVEWDYYFDSSVLYWPDYGEWSQTFLATVSPDGGGAWVSTGFNMRGDPDYSAPWEPEIRIIGVGPSDTGPEQWHEDLLLSDVFPTDGWYTFRWAEYQDGSYVRRILYRNGVVLLQYSYVGTLARSIYNTENTTSIDIALRSFGGRIDNFRLYYLPLGEVDPPVDPGLEETISDLLYLPDYYLWRFTVKDGEITSEYDNRIFDAFRTGEVVSYDPFANYAYKTIEDIIRIRALLDNSRTRDSGGVANTEYEDTISDFLVNVDDLLQTPNLFMGFTDEIALEDLVTPSGTFSESLSEIVLFIPVKDEPGICFNTYSFNSRINAVSEYTNYNFNSYTVYQTRAYGASSEGFYLLEGCTDNEDPIVVKLRTAAMDFGTSNLKSIPQVYLGITQDSSIIMKVAVDGKAETYHKLDLATNHLGTQRIKLPKGHIGRWFQFELESETASEFNLDSIEFYLMPFRRKI